MTHHLISDTLVRLIEDHTVEILKRWRDQIENDPTTQSFSEKNMDYIETKLRSVLGYLGKWVSYDTGKEEVGKLYAREGIELFKMKIPLCEAERALFVLRRTLWLFVENECSFESAYQMHQMRELSDRVILFFDRALYYLIRGYTEEMNRAIKELWNLDTDDTEKIFFDKSFYDK